MANAYVACIKKSQSCGTTAAIPIVKPTKPIGLEGHDYYSIIWVIYNFIPNDIGKWFIVSEGPRWEDLKPHQVTLEDTYCYPNIVYGRE